MSTQSYANHTRWNPLVHFILTPLLSANLVFWAVRTYQECSADHIALLILGIVLIGVSVSARLQALTVQDRLIRLEEDLRYTRLLSPDLAERAIAQPLKKKIAMRFASDEELSDIVAKVIEGRLNTNKEIKQAVRKWRSDELRA